MARSQDISSVIFDKLYEGILSLDIMPGSTLKESEVCQMFNASRTPVRAAILRLSDKNLVDILPYKDNRVSLINMKNVRQLIYARAAIEERVLRDFAAQNNMLLEEDMDHVIRRQQIIISQPNFKPVDFYDMDMEFHHIWYRATGNEAIFDFFYSHEDYRRLRILDMKTGKDYESIIAEHKEVSAIIKSRKLELLYPHVLKHLMGCYDRTVAKEEQEASGYLVF